MAKRQPNKPIGTCPCPFRDCDKTVPVKRYRSSTDDPAKQRYAGRLYLICPTHGKSEDQEWILEHGTITGEDNTNEPTATESAEPKASEPSNDDKGGFGFF